MRSLGLSVRQVCASVLWFSKVLFSEARAVKPRTKSILVVAAVKYLAARGGEG